jgi:putative tryptophan/tyrosine transport system substrate-binding protein
MRRREFIAALGAVAWPLAGRAQQRDRMPRIGVLMPYDENDPLAKARLSVFTQAFADLGWTDGRNVRMDLRWATDDTDRIRALAQELVGSQSDIVLAGSTTAIIALQRETRTIPIVFANVVDPITNGIVTRLDRPGGNVTGFANLEASLGGKWLELLSEIAPGLKRVAGTQTTAPDRLLCPHLRRRPGHSRSHQSLRPFTATQRSKRPLSPLGASQEAASSLFRVYS